jgi:hypothetical protein
MKNIIILGLFLLVFFAVSAQVTKGGKTIDVFAKQITLEVSDINTTHLIFKEKIKYVDIGSPFFVADTLNTLVKLKHTGQGLRNPEISKQSNLTLVSESGRFYSFKLKYNRYAKNFSYQLDKNASQIEHLKKEKDQETQERRKFDEMCIKFSYKPTKIRRRKKNDNLKLSLLGIYFNELFLGFKVEIENMSSIDFEVDDILIRTKLNRRITPDFVYQERVYKPFDICNKKMLIKGGNDYSSMVLLFEKFTPNKNEKMYFDVFEKDGGRSISLKIPRKAIFNAHVIK